MDGAAGSGVHRVLIGSSDAELVDGTVAFVCEGLDAGQPVVVACTEPTTDLLQKALADRPQVHRAEWSDVYGNGPAAAITAVRRLGARYRTAATPVVRVVLEPRAGEDQDTWREWQRYDAVLDHELDEAEALGQVDCDLGADVAYAPGRKWLAGPRGVGVLVMRPSITAQLTPVLPAELFDDGGAGLDHTRPYESADAHVAGRVGLVHAVGEHQTAGPQRVRERLAALGRTTRERLDGRGGWAVVEPADEPTAITTLRPPDGVDVRQAAVRLHREHGVLVTPVGVERARRELTGPVLRVAPHLDATLDDLDTLARALAS
jgi:hypothetical protein